MKNILICTTQFSRILRNVFCWRSIAPACLICVSIFISLGANAETPSTREKLVITIPPKEKTSEAHAIYFPTLLRLALSKTVETDGPFEILEHPVHLNGARFVAELKRHHWVDVIWTVDTPQLQNDLLAIRVPLLKDLNSYRIFLIRAEDQPRFNQVKSVMDLQQFTAGQGAHWPDTRYLVDNDLTVVTSTQFELLFTMLIGKRFDFFPRGLDEVWNEAELFKDKGIVIEKHLMLNYKANKYFFVAKDRIELADRIERGLKIAQKDGSFDALFNSIPGFKRGLQEIHSNQRLVFHLTSESD